jgi:hypothetical protein
MGMFFLNTFFASPKSFSVAFSSDNPDLSKERRNGW